MPPLTDQQQGILTLVSNILIAVGAISVAVGSPWYVGLIIASIGAIGNAMKEWMGAIPTPPPLQPQPPVNPNTDVQKIIDNAKTQGFDVDAAKKTGYTVYLNPSEVLGLVLFFGGAYYDVYGTYIGTKMPENTGQAI